MRISKETTTARASMSAVLSTYEIRRLQNMERNEEKLRALGILAPRKVSSVEAPPKGKLSRQSNREHFPRRQSERVREAPAVMYDEQRMCRQLFDAVLPPRKRPRVPAVQPPSSSMDVPPISDAALIVEAPSEAPPPFEGVPEGMLLHRSRNSETGYAGVIRLKITPLPFSDRPYLALGPRNATTGVKPLLGYFRTAEEGAVAFARHIQSLDDSLLSKAGTKGSSASCFHVAPTAEGMQLHLSHRSSTGYEGVRLHKLSGRFRAVSPLDSAKRGGTRGGTSLGYYETAQEAAVAFAKYVESPMAWEEWRAAQRAAAQQKKDDDDVAREKPHASSSRQTKPRESQHCSTKRVANGKARCSKAGPLQSAATGQPPVPVPMPAEHSSTDDRAHQQEEVRQKESSADEDDDEEEYEVEAIVSERLDRRGRIEYQVKWVGWEDPTWEPAAHLEESAALDAWL